MLWQQQSIVSSVCTGQNSPARIVFLNMYGTRAREILCEVMTYSSYRVKQKSA